jgi:hypothetical protein
LATTQNWVYGLIIYFFSVFVIVSLMSLGGYLSSNVQTEGGYTPQQLRNMSRIEAPAGDTSLIPDYDLKSYAKDIFSFFLWNINVTGDSLLANYMWLVRLIFVYLPLLFLAIAFYYSLPTVSG